MTEGKTATRDRIIETTAEIVGRENNLSLTIRDIAERAGVNVASVNYYFRSKDNLMEEVEKKLLNKTGFIYELLQDKSGSAEERLISWGDNLMQFLVDYPGILYMMGNKVLSFKNESTGLADYLSILIESLMPVIKELTVESSKGKYGAGNKGVNYEDKNDCCGKDLTHGECNGDSMSHGVCGGKDLSHEECSEDNMAHGEYSRKDMSHEECSGDSMTHGECILFYKSLQLMSGVIYPLLLYSGTGKTFFPAVTNAAERRKYLTVLVHSLALPSNP